MAFNFDNIPSQPVSAAGEPELVSTIVDLLTAAPRPLTLKEIVTVLNDSEIETPADTTVRAHLNRARADGRISKPSRQSYAGPVAEGEAQFDIEIAAEGLRRVAEEDDPLADL
jgi:hypothetical protein